jgi:hypothetical protein
MRNVALLVPKCKPKDQILQEILSLGPKVFNDCILKMENGEPVHSVTNSPRHAAGS